MESFQNVMDACEPMMAAAADLRDTDRAFIAGYIYARIEDCKARPVAGPEEPAA